MFEEILTDGGSTDGPEDRKRRAEEASIESGRLDEILRLLTDQRCRWVLYCFFEEGADVLDYEAVVDYVADHVPGVDGTEDPRIRLHHSTLPKLKEAGLVDFDSRTGTIRYDGGREIDTVLAWLDEMETDGR